MPAASSAAAAAAVSFGVASFRNETASAKRNCPLSEIVFIRCNSLQ